MKAIYYIIIVALLLSASCEMKRELIGGKENEVIDQTVGVVDLKLELETEVNTEETLSKSGTKVDIEDFAVEIIDSLGSIIYDFESYAEYREANVLLTEGKYTFRSRWGVLHQAAFDAPFFLSDTTINVTPGEVTSIAAKCKLQNTKINVSYTDDFLKVFKDDYAAVITNNLGVLTLDMSETRVAYFSTKENIRIEINATTHRGLDITTKHNFVDVEPNMLYDLELGIDVSVESVIDNLLKPGITIDVTMHDRDTIINIAPPELPVEPGDGAITIAGTGILTPVVMTQAEAAGGSVPVKVTILAPAGLKKVYVKVINDDLEAVLGDENPFELINPSETMGELLEGVGLVRPLAGDREYALNITGFMGLMGTGISKFKVDVEDNDGNKAVATLTIEIK